MLGGLVHETGSVTNLRRLPTRRDHYQADLAALAALLQAEAATAGTETVAVGIGTTGFVDSSAGVLVSSITLGLQNIPIRASVSLPLGLPVFVDNDVHAAAVGELRFGVGNEHQDFVLVNAGTGVAAGLVIGGRVAHGASNSAGELGHMSVAPTGPKCACGLPGCLEAMVIAERNGIRLDPPQLGDGVTPPPDAGLGYLAVGITGLVNLVNPSAVVLAGGRFSSDPAAVEWLATAVRQMALPRARDVLDFIGLSASGPNAGVLGAGALALTGHVEPLERALS